VVTIRDTSQNLSTIKGSTQVQYWLPKQQIWITFSPGA
jgi:hypothetical protein